MFRLSDQPDFLPEEEGLTPREDSAVKAEHVDIKVLTSGSKEKLQLEEQEDHSPLKADGSDSKIADVLDIGKDKSYGEVPVTLPKKPNVVQLPDIHHPKKSQKSPRSPKSATSNPLSKSIHDFRQPDVQSKCETPTSRHSFFATKLSGAGGAKNSPVMKGPMMSLTAKPWDHLNHRSSIAMRQQKILDQVGLCITLVHVSLHLPETYEVLCQYKS